jgi:hypothetical protein
VRHIVLLSFLLLLPPNAAADPLTFSNVLAVQLDAHDDTHSVTTDLFSTPNAVLTNGTIVSFFIDVAGPPVGDALRLSYEQRGQLLALQEYAIPVFGTVYPPFTLVTGLDFPTFYHPVPVTLTVDLLQSSPDFVIPSGPLAGQAVDSYTYTFSVVQPVPEPSSLVLLTTGIAGMAVALRRRWRKAAPPPSPTT